MKIPTILSNPSAVSSAELQLDKPYLDKRNHLEPIQAHQWLTLELAWLMEEDSVSIWLSMLRQEIQFFMNAALHNFSPDWLVDYFKTGSKIIW